MSCHVSDSSYLIWKELFLSMYSHFKYKKGCTVAKLLFATYTNTRLILTNICCFFLDNRAPDLTQVFSETSLQLSGGFSGVENESKVWDNLLNDYLWICRYVRSLSLHWHATACEIFLCLVKVVEQSDNPEYFGGYSNLGGQELHHIERHSEAKQAYCLGCYTHIIISLIEANRLA